MKMFQFLLGKGSLQTKISYKEYFSHVRFFSKTFAGDAQLIWEDTGKLGGK